MRLAVRRGRIERLPLLFSGKLAVREIGAIAALVLEHTQPIDLAQMEIHLEAALE